MIQGVEKKMGVGDSGFRMMRMWYPRFMAKAAAAYMNGLSRGRIEGELASGAASQTMS